MSDPIYPAKGYSMESRDKVMDELLPPLKGHEYRLDLYIDDGFTSLREKPLTHYMFAESYAHALEKYFADPAYCGDVFRITITEDPDTHSDPNYTEAHV